MILDDAVYRGYKDHLQKFIDTEVLFRANPEVVYSEGLEPGKMYGNPYIKNMTYQFFVRRLTHNPIMCHSAVALIADHIAGNIEDGTEHPTFQFCGLETGSLPLIAALQMYFLQVGVAVNAFTVRKSRKPYGLFNLIEGTPNKNPIIFIDDLIHSGNSCRRVKDVVEYEVGVESAKNAYCIVHINKFGNWVGDTAINTIFKLEDFDRKYDPEKYWEPRDVQKFENMRKDYK